MFAVAAVSLHLSRVHFLAVAGETAAAGQTLARMASHLAAIEDPESRDWAAEALAALQAACPGAARSGAGPATAPGWVRPVRQRTASSMFGAMRGSAAAIGAGEPFSSECRMASRMAASNSLAL